MNKTRIDENGTMYVKKTMSTGLSGLEEMAFEREAWYKCLDISGDGFYRLTLFGGWFGLHKYMTGHFIQGLIYTLTFGVCGVSYIFDLLYEIMGCYADDTYTYEKVSGMDVKRSKVRQYARPVTVSAFTYISFVVAAIMTYLAIKYGYIRVMADLFNGLSILVTEKREAIG